MQTSASPGPPPVLVEDHREHRIRRPADLLRCLACIAGVVVLAGLGIVASATADGVETNIVEVSRSVPHALLVTARPLALFALLLLTVALAIRQLVRRQGRTLAEAVATGVLAGAATAAANYLLRRRAAGRLYDAITMSKLDVTHLAALDGYLAALVAFAAVLGLGGRQARWRTALWLLICLYAVVNLSASTTTVLSLLISVLIGGAIGLGVRYAAGSIPTRPTAEEIAGALASAGCPVSEMRRVLQTGDATESRRYASVALGAGRLDVFVYDWDQQAAGLLYRLYRLVRLPRQVSRGAPLSQDRATERLALLSYAAQDAGVPMPRLCALVRVRPGGGRARLRASRRPDPVRPRRRADRRPARPGLGRRAAAARAPGHAPGAHRRPHPADRRRPGPAAPADLGRRGRDRPADPPRPGAADGRARAAGRPGPVRRRRDGEDSRR